MKRVAVLIFCLVAYTMASVYDAAPYVKKRHRARDVVYPYMEVSAGGMYSVSDYKTKSKTNYYHDLKRDEMVYDKDLYYNIYSFEGITDLFYLIYSFIDIDKRSYKGIHLCFRDDILSYYSNK